MLQFLKSDLHISSEINLERCSDIASCILQFVWESGLHSYIGEFAESSTGRKSRIVVIPDSTLSTEYQYKKTVWKKWILSTVISLSWWRVDFRIIDGCYWKNR